MNAAVVEFSTGDTQCILTSLSHPKEGIRPSATCPPSDLDELDDGLAGRAGRWQAPAVG